VLDIEGHFCCGPTSLWCASRVVASEHTIRFVRFWASVWAKFLKMCRFSAQDAVEPPCKIWLH